MNFTRMSKLTGKVVAGVFELILHVRFVSRLGTWMGSKRGSKEPRLSRMICVGGHRGGGTSSSKVRPQQWRVEVELRGKEEEEVEEWRPVLKWSVEEVIRSMLSSDLNLHAVISWDNRMSTLGFDP